jgi:DNA-binding response OmpR family regulator
MATLLFLGLESPSHGKLESILEAQGHRVLRAEDGRSYVADAVFCNGDDEKCSEIPASTRGSLQGLPLIVVTQNPRERKWREAIESGAVHYCSAPFEPAQMKWILDPLLKPAPLPSLARLEPALVRRRWTCQCESTVAEPNSRPDTVLGPSEFHDWIGDGCAVLFSHPKDFTPVCSI